MDTPDEFPNYDTIPEEIETVEENQVETGEEEE